MLPSDPTTLPSNSSRYFEDRLEAQSQPSGSLALALSADGHIYNSLHRPDLVRYDKNYFTTSCNISGATRWLPTLEYLPQVLERWPSRPPSVCDIGCGQGELVQALRSRGIDARGFDPVLQETSDQLHRQYWTADHPDGDADLLVMRCVLPHIPAPWDFIASLATRPRHVLIEYQRIEWIFERGVWCGLNHDHVNYFRLVDFDRRGQLVDHGTFAEGEWAWVLLHMDPDAAQGGGGDTEATPRPLTPELSIQVERLVALRTNVISALEREGRPVVVWGAAGKGMVAADALHQAGLDVRAAVDADKGKWGFFLERSGVEVQSPASLLEITPNGSRLVVVVVNPRHREEVRQRLGDSFTGTLRGLSDIQ